MLSPANCTSHHGLQSLLFVNAMFVIAEEDDEGML